MANGVATVDLTLKDLLHDELCFVDVSAGHTEMLNLVVARSCFMLLTVQPVLKAIHDAGGTLSDPIRQFIHRRTATPGQSGMVEDGFLRERRADARASNVTSHSTLWTTLITRHIINSVYNYTDNCGGSLVARRADLPSGLFAPSSGDTTLDVSGIRG